MGHRKYFNRTAKLDIRLVNSLQGSKTITFAIVFVVDKNLQVNFLLHSSCTIIKKYIAKSGTGLFS